MCVSVCACVSETSSWGFFDIPQNFFRKCIHDQTLSTHTHTHTHTINSGYSLEVRLEVKMQHTAVLSETAHPSPRQLELSVHERKSVCHLRKLVSWVTGGFC